MRLPRLVGEPRTTTGRSDHVVVVGAGLAGLSAAMRLAGAGRQVTVLERDSEPGGRAGVLRRDGYTFDTGPTVLTMPELIADAFDCLDEKMEDWLELSPVDPLYRAFFADGSQLDVHADPEAMATEIAAVCGPREADGYRRFVRFVSDLYRVEMRTFIDRNLDSPLDLVSTDMVRLLALGGLRRLAPKVAQYLRDPRTQRVFSFQAMYAGLSPYDALAIYSVISYMDSVAGVWFPKGGVHAVPVAMAAAAAAHGVEFRYFTDVERVELAGDRAVAVHTADGERVACDAVVLNPDLPVARRDLLGRPLRRHLDFSPSCVALNIGSTASYSKIGHHNIHFGNAWKDVFTDLVDAKRLMRDPAYMVTSPSMSDPGLAPAGRHSYCVIFTAPNLDGPIDWRREAKPYRDEIVATLERAGYVGFGDAIEVEKMTTPLDWERQGMERGAPFAAAHSFAQTGPFRPSNIWGENVVFAGSGTQPGVGVPMVLISGRLAAERITGPDPHYRSRAWR
jgi:phytoene desaturase